MDEVQKYLQKASQLQGQPRPGKWRIRWHRLLCRFGKHEISGHLHVRSNKPNKQKRIKVKCRWCLKFRWFKVEQKKPLIPQATMDSINKQILKNARRRAYNGN